MDKYDLRRRRVSMVIVTKFKGKRAEFARKVGLSESYVARMLYTGDRPGRKRIGEDMVDRIAKAVNMDPAWFDEPLTTPEGEAGAPSGGIDSEIEPVADGKVTEDRADLEMVLVPESTVQFSPTGEPHYELFDDEEMAAYHITWFEKNRMKPDRAKRLRVQGDSQEPFLFDGDTVLINLDETEVTDGKLYAIRYNAELRFRFLFRKLDGALTLHCMNPKYPEEEVPETLAARHIQILGRVRDRSGSGGI